MSPTHERVEQLPRSPPDGVPRTPSVENVAAQVAGAAFCVPGGTVPTLTVTSEALESAIQAAFELQRIVDETCPRRAPGWAISDAATGEVWIGGYDAQGNWVPPTREGQAETLAREYCRGRDDQARATEEQRNPRGFPPREKHRDTGAGL